MLKTNDIYIKIYLQEEMLGTCPSEKDIYKKFKAGESPQPDITAQEELDAIVPKEFGDEENPEKALTIFSKDSNGNPMMWDYQVKGFFKDACGMLQKVTGKDEDGKKKKAANESSKLTAYKKIIDGLIFVYPRMIPITLPEGGEILRCQRPLRANTPQGERVALSDSETVPAGSVIICKISCFSEDHLKQVYEWLEYGQFRGLGQWRNSGKGRFTYEEITKEEYDEFYKNYNQSLS